MSATQSSSTEEHRYPILLNDSLTNTSLAVFSLWPHSVTFPQDFLSFPQTPSPPLQNEMNYCYHIIINRVSLHWQISMTSFSDMGLLHLTWILNLTWTGNRKLTGKFKYPWILLLSLNMRQTFSSSFHIARSHHPQYKMTILRKWREKRTGWVTADLEKPF